MRGKKCKTTPFLKRKSQPDGVEITDISTSELYAEDRLQDPTFARIFAEVLQPSWIGVDERLNA